MLCSKLVMSWKIKKFTDNFWYTYIQCIFRIIFQVVNVILYKMCRKSIKDTNDNFAEIY